MAAFRRIPVIPVAQLSRGSCYNPDCTRPIISFIDGEPYVDYQIAHIRDASRAIGMWPA